MLEGKRKGTQGEREVDYVMERKDNCREMTVKSGEGTGSVGQVSMSVSGMGERN